MFQCCCNARSLPSIPWDWEAGKDKVTEISMVKSMGESSETWEEVVRERLNSDD